MKPPTTLSACAGLLALVCVAPPAPAQPVTLTFAAQQYGSALGQSDGSELPAESLVRFGYFTVPFEQVMAGLGNPSLLESSFIQLAQTRVGYFGGTTVLDATGAVVSNQEPASPYEEAPGLFGHTLTYDPAAMGLIEARYYLWVIDAPDTASATEFGLFSDADWRTPGFPDSPTYDTATVDPANPLDLYAADRGPEISSVPGFGPLNKLRPIEGIPVPEPHLPALVLAAAGFLGWRRRRPHTHTP